VTPTGRAIDVSGADLDAIGAKRKEMGDSLRERRRTAKMTQAELGAKAGAGRSTISNAENGSRDFSRDFWARLDKAFGLGTHFTDWYSRVYAGIESSVPARPDPPAELLVSSVIANPVDLGEALAEYRQLGWPVVEQSGGGIALATGAVIDALEVSRAAGVIAAHSWLESGGREDIVCGLPVLPSPAACLAAIDAGDRWYVLTRSGASPWTGPVPRPGERPVAVPATARPRPGTEGVLWHASNSSVPLPPSPSPSPGPGTVTWAFLPRPTLQLAPPVTVLHLLGRTVAMACSPGVLALPSGTLVAPAARLAPDSAAGDHQQVPPTRGSSTCRGCP
jgi:transcriptional regulator with XRE-family HTH domain